MAGSQGVVAGDRQIQGLTHDDDRFGPVIPVHPEGHIQLPGLHLIKDIKGRALCKLEADAPVVLLPVEALHQRRDQGGGDAVEVAQLGYLGQIARHLFQNSGPLVQQGQGTLHIGEKLFPIGGQADLPVLLLEQLDPQFLFQLADGIAEGGVGDVQLFRRPGVVQDTGQDLKILELKQSQEVHLPAWFGEAGVEPEGVDSWCRV